MKKAYANYIAVFDHITAVLLDHSNKKKSPLSAFLEVRITVSPTTICIIYLFIYLYLFISGENDKGRARPQGLPHHARPATAPLRNPPHRTSLFFFLFM
jgi:hypothetical protein